MPAEQGDSKRLTARASPSSRPDQSASEPVEPTGSLARYRRLPTGAHGLTREEVARDQRERLQTAMIELIAERGYPAVRILDLTQLAHVSRPTFYNLYADKEELLLDAYTDIAQRTSEVVSAGFGTEGSLEERLASAMRAFVELAAAEPEAMSLALFGTFGAGPRALERRERTLQGLEQKLQTGRGDASGTLPVDLTVKFTIGGIREVTASRLRRGRAPELSELAVELADWAASYPPELPSGLQRPRRIRRAGSIVAPDRASERGRRAEGRLPSGRHDLPRQLVVKSQRERIVDATAAIVAAKGLAGLTIPEIASRANVSHETFYEMYPTKHDAFLGAQKVGLHQALRVTSETYEERGDDWAAGVAAGLRALIEFLASEPAHAHLTIVDTFAASPEAIEIRDRALQAFTAFLTPGRESPVEGLDAPEVSGEAIVGGIWQVLHHYIEHERIGELSDAAPQLIYLTLTPFLGPEQASALAQRPLDGRSSPGSGRFSRD
jgi:AcrR family transcriptional regulator